MIQHAQITTGCADIDRMARSCDDAVAIGSIFMMCSNETVTAWSQIGSAHRAAAVRSRPCCAQPSPAPDEPRRRCTHRSASRGTAETAECEDVLEIPAVAWVSRSPRSNFNPHPIANRCQLPTSSDLPNRSVDPTCQSRKSPIRRSRSCTITLCCANQEPQRHEISARTLAHCAIRRAQHQPSAPIECDGENFAAGQQDPRLPNRPAPSPNNEIHRWRPVGVNKSPIRRC